MIFLDISKAFDKVYHQGLIFKLRQYGFEGNILAWLESYLIDRHQRVVINGACSEWKYTNAGVPQGSILGPLLFLIFINDIVENIQSSIYIFADDTSLLSPIENPVSTFETLNNDLQKLYNWANQWRVTFNAKKTEYMIFSYKNKLPNYPSLFLGNQKITLVKKHTHLGLTFDTKMTWKEHITNISYKANQRLNNIKRIRHIIPRKVADNLYKALVRPTMEYGDVIFDNVSQHLVKQLEQVQREAMVMITQSYRRTPTKNLHKETGLSPLMDRRKEHRLIMYYKIVNNLAPDYLKVLLPQQINANVKYNLKIIDN